MHKNQPDITRRYLASKKEKGQRRVTVVVPESKVDEVKALAAKWRKEAESG